jgi:hypothetical protein
MVPAAMWLCTCNFWHGDPMSLLLELAFSAALVGSPGPIARVEPDSGSVAVCAASPALDLEDALALLQAEHHFSIPMLLTSDPTSP